MEKFTIRFAMEQDIPAIMQFIDENWRKGHILATDRHLFEWQYINYNKVNMVIGLDDEENIRGILGYIPYAAGDQKDYSLALWKAQRGTGFLGVKLLMFLMQNEPYRMVFCNGINMKTTAGIYQRMGFTTGKLKQWYRLRKQESYQIAKIKKQQIPDYSLKGEANLERVYNFSEMKEKLSSDFFTENPYPNKSESYLAKRYFEHPAYDYAVYTVSGKDKRADAIVVFRIQSYADARALRLIDFVGQPERLFQITEKIDQLLQEQNAEYADMYETGLEDRQLYKAGWLQVGEDENIIPNYFAPYAPCNVDIYFCTTAPGIVLFKGDGDQDRPN